MDEFVNILKGIGDKKEVEDFREEIIGGSQSYRRQEGLTQACRLNFERRRNPSCELGEKENMWDEYLLIIYRRSLMAHVDQDSLLKEKRGQLLRVSKQR